jgi:integrase
LTEHRKRQVARCLAAATRADNDLILIGTGEGELLHPSKVDRGFHRLVKAARVRRDRLHDARHAPATWLLAEGTPVNVVSERLGHAKVSITLDTYAHVLPGMQDGAGAAVEWLLFDKPA